MQFPANSDGPDSTGENNGLFGICNVDFPKVCEDIFIEIPFYALFS